MLVREPLFRSAILMSVKMSLKIDQTVMKCDRTPLIGSPH